MNSKLYLFTILLFFNNLLFAQQVNDDFEGNGNIALWQSYDCQIDSNKANPFTNGINNSPTVLEYKDMGGQYAHTYFDNEGFFQLSDSAVFSFKIYLPSSGITGSQTNQVYV